MAKLAISSQNILALSSSKKIRVYKFNSEKYQELELTGRVTSLHFSPCGQYLAAASEDKLLHLWKSDQEHWSLLSSRKLVRKSSCLVFSPNHILVADGTGYVTQYPLTFDPSAPGSSLLGHCSMLLDMVLSEDGRFIITADRDEKIRVSHFPESYDIHTYCLGHLEFVSNIATVPGHPTWLLSASGDETLRLWDFSLEGKQKSSHNYGQGKGRLPPKHLVCTSQPLVLLFPTGDNVCMVYQVDNDGHLALRNRHPLPAATWDICLDVLNRLWIILEPGLVQVYQVLPEGQLRLEDTFSSPLLNHLKEESQIFFTDCPPPEQVPFLYKRSYDNLTEYFQRKQERMAKKIKMDSVAEPELMTS